MQGKHQQVISVAEGAMTCRGGGGRGFGVPSGFKYGILSFRVSVLQVGASSV